MDNYYKMRPARDIVQVNGRIHPASDQLKFKFWGSAKAPIITSPAGVDEIQRKVRALNTALAGLPLQATPASEFGERMRPVAEAGAVLFDAVIAPGDRDRFLRLLTMGKSASPAGQRTPVIADETAVRLPWHLMYTGAPDRPASFEQFLGARFLFLNAARNDDVGLRSEERGAHVQRSGWMRGQTAKVGHLWDEDFLEENQPENERWYFNLSDLDLQTMDPLSPEASVRDAMTADLWDFVTKARDFLHFDCHGHPDADDPDLHELGILERFRAGESVVSAWEFLGNVRMLCVSNACKSGYARLKSAEGSIAEILVKKGVAGVVAPLSPVNYHSAMKLSRKIYARLLRGASVLEAFDLSQLELARSDIRALAYAPFGEYDFYMSPLTRPAGMRHAS
jgi:hypothetical protein